MKINKTKKDKIEKLLKNKKGVFFTIGAFLLMLSLITVMSITNRAENIDQDLAIDRTFEISDSVEQCILDIFFEYAGLKVEITKNPDGTTDVSFKESLKSRDLWEENFFAVVRKFEEFVRSEEPTLLINLAEIEDKQMKMVIKPHNVSYAAVYYGPDKISLFAIPSPGDPPNFGAIEIAIDTKEIGFGPKPLTWKKVGEILTPPDPNGIYFNVSATSDEGRIYSLQEYVNFYDETSAEIKFGLGNNLDVKLKDGIVEIYSNEHFAVDVETKIISLEETDERVRITVYDSVINNSLPTLDVYRMDDVVIEAEEI